MRIQRGILAALCALLMATSAAACTDSESNASPTSDDRATQPLPGATDQGIRIGVVRLGDAPAASLGFDQPFRRLSDESIASLIPRGSALGTRVVSAVAISDVAVEGAVDGDSPGAVCEAQRDSAVVILTTNIPDLAACIARAGTIVVDASGAGWTGSGLDGLAPFVWATATADAEVAERVLWEQAEQRVLVGDSVAILDGPDATSLAVTEDVSLPLLTASGASVERVSIATGSFEDGLSSTEAVLESSAGTLRPSGERAFILVASSGESLVDRRVLVTSTGYPGYGVARPTALKADAVAVTEGVGWAPIDDGTVLPGQGQVATNSSARANCLQGPRSNSVAALEEERALLRLCDAIQLVRLGSNAQDLTAATFRDAVWSSGATWQPLAVSASGWNSGSFFGANSARWFQWDETCAAPDAPLPTGCFAYEGPDLPLTPLPPPTP